MREKKIIMQKRERHYWLKAKINLSERKQKLYLWPKSIFGPLLKTRNALGSSAIPNGLKDQ